MAVYTPRLLKIRLSHESAFTLMSRHHPDVTPTMYLTTVEYLVRAPAGVATLFCAASLGSEFATYWGQFGLAVILTVFGYVAFTWWVTRDLPWPPHVWLGAASSRFGAFGIIGLFLAAVWLRRPIVMLGYLTGRVVASGVSAVIGRVFWDGPKPAYSVAERMFFRAHDYFDARSGPLREPLTTWQKLKDAYYAHHPEAADRAAQSSDVAPYL